MDSAHKVGMVISLTTWIKSWPTYRFNWCWGPTRIHHAPWPFHDARPTPSVALRKTRTAYPWPSCPCARWWRPLGCQTSSHAREWWRRGRTALWGRLGLSGWRMAPGWMVVRYVNASEQANTSLWRGEGLRAQIQGTHGSPGQPLCSSLLKVSVGRYHSTLLFPCRKPTTSNSKLLDHHPFPSKYGKSLGWFLALPRETIINAGSTIQ
jgi:hypothetical protein